MIKYSGTFRAEKNYLKRKMEFDEKMEKLGKLSYKDDAHQIVVDEYASAFNFTLETTIQLEPKVLEQLHLDTGIELFQMIIEDWENYIDVDRPVEEIRTDLKDWLDEESNLVLINFCDDYRDTFIRKWAGLFTEDFEKLYY